METTYYACDTIYVDRNNGRFEVYTYGDGTKHLIMTTTDIAKINRYAKKYHYNVVMVLTSPEKISSMLWESGKFLTRQ
jgi:hypothetical protein